LLERIARDAGQWPPSVLSREAFEDLQRHGFPGNVRELENLLHRAVAMASSATIERADLGLAADLVVDTDPAEVEARLAQVRAAPLPPTAAPLPDNLEAYMDAVERDILVRALERHRNNRTAAGASLGLSLRQMRYRMARLGVVVSGHDAE
jgi:two-component system response regulator PilR (NtrC family)